MEKQTGSYRWRRWTVRWPVESYRVRTRIGVPWVRDSLQIETGCSGQERQERKKEKEQTQENENQTQEVKTSRDVLDGLLRTRKITGTKAKERC